MTWRWPAKISRPRAQIRRCCSRASGRACSSKPTSRRPMVRMDFRSFKQRGSGPMFDAPMRPRGAAPLTYRAFSETIDEVEPHVDPDAGPTLRARMIAAGVISPGLRLPDIRRYRGRPCLALDEEGRAAAALHRAKGGVQER